MDARTYAWTATANTVGAGVGGCSIYGSLREDREVVARQRG